MSRALLVLQRIREQKKRGARLVHAAAVRKQEEHKAAIAELNSSIEGSYGSEPLVASDLTYASVYRARMRQRANREEVRLKRHTQAVNVSRERLVSATIAAEVLGRVIETEQAVEERRRKRAMERATDELSATRWAGYSA